MGKYEQLAKEIIANIGGKGNVSSLTHCVTRLRFKLKNESKADDEKVKNIDGVVTLMKSGGQYQIVIGNHVPEVYKEVMDQLGLSSDEAGSSEPENSEKPKKSAVVIDFISGIINPILATMSASGILKGLLTIFVATGLLKEDPNGIYAILSALSDAVFYFLPVVLGYTSAKKLNIDPFVGLLIGATLMYPTIQGVDLNILGQTVNVTYTSTAIPVVLTTIFASFIYKRLMKVIPDVVKTFVVPLITLLIAAPIGYLVIGPVGNMVSMVLAQGIMAVYDFSPILAGLILGGLFQILVVFGLHIGLVVVAMIQLTSGQPTPIFSLGGAASFAQTAVVFAIWLKTKDKKLKDIALPAWISGIFGVTEPAIYGITLPRIKFFIISCIGSAIGGAYAGFSGLLVYQMPGLGIFGFPAMIPSADKVGVTAVNYLIMIALAMITSFVATFIMFKDEEVETSDSPKEIKDRNVSIQSHMASPIKGESRPLSTSSDEAFKSGILGEGVVIIPSEGKVFAPFDGTVTTLFPTLHAIGLTSNDGVEMLIHIGMDTVNLEGKGFIAHCQQGDKVTAGQLLLEFDIAEIESAGYSIETPIILTNSKDMLDVIFEEDQQASTEDTLFTVVF